MELVMRNEEEKIKRESYVSTMTGCCESRHLTKSVHLSSKRR